MCKRPTASGTLYRWMACNEQPQNSACRVDLILTISHGQYGYFHCSRTGISSCGLGHILGGFCYRVMTGSRRGGQFGGQWFSTIQFNKRFKQQNRFYGNISNETIK